MNKKLNNESELTYTQLKKKFFFLLNINFISTILNLILGIGIFISIFSSKHFILGNNGDIQELKPVKDIPFSEERAVVFCDNLSKTMFNVDFNNIEIKLTDLRKFYDEKNFNGLMQRLNIDFVPNVIQRKVIITIVPSPTLYRVLKISDNTYEVYRSYVRTDISMDRKEQKEMYYKFTIIKIKPTQTNFYGFIIKNMTETKLN